MEESNIPIAVAGAMAVNFCGYVRQTSDIRIGIRREDLPSLLALLTQLKSVCTIRINGPVSSVKSIRNIAEFPRLEEFGSHGSTGWCQQDALRFVVSIQSVK